MRRRTAIGLTAAAVAVPTFVRAQSATVKVATTPIDVGAEVLYADDLGIFKKNGLTVETQFIDNGAAIASAVASGALNVAQANLVSLATAHERGLPFVVLAPAGLYNAQSPTSALIVAKNSPLKTAKDLNGKTVSVTGIKNITQIATIEWLEKNGADPTSVKFIEIPFSQVAPAVKSGRVDAGVTAEPFLSEALATDARILAPVYDAIAPVFVIGAWFTSASWAKSNPDVVKRFTASIYEAGAWANKNRAASAKILEKYTKAPLSPQTRRATYGEKLDVAEMQPIIDASAKYGAIKTTFPATDLILK